MATIQCPVCGYEYEGKFCPNCGAKLGFKYRMRAAARAKSEGAEAAPEMEFQQAPKQASSSDTKNKSGRGLVILGGACLTVFLSAGLLLFGAGRKVTKQVESIFHWNEYQDDEYEYDFEDDIWQDEEVYDIEPQTLYATESFEVQWIGYEKNSYSDRMQIECTNHTDSDVYISSSMLTVNGVAMDSGFYATVGAGESVVEEIIFFLDDLDDNGIDSVDEIQFKIRAYDAETYRTVGQSDQVTIASPDGETASDRVPVEGDEIYNKDGIRVIALGLEETTYASNLTYYIENRTGYDVEVFGNDDVRINHEMSEESYMYFDFVEIPAGADGYYRLSLYDFEDNGHDLDELETAEFSFRIDNAEDGSPIDTVYIVYES